MKFIQVTLIDKTKLKADAAESDTHCTEQIIKALSRGWFCMHIGGVDTYIPINAVLSITTVAK